MKRRLLSLIYLVAKDKKTTYTTANINSIVNKIPCDEESFYKLTPA